MVAGANSCNGIDSTGNYGRDYVCITVVGGENSSTSLTTTLHPAAGGRKSGVCKITFPHSRKVLLLSFPKPLEMACWPELPRVFIFSTLLQLMIYPIAPFDLPSDFFAHLNNLFG